MADKFIGIAVGMLIMFVILKAEPSPAQAHETTTTCEDYEEILVNSATYTEYIERLNPWQMGKVSKGMACYMWKLEHKGD